MFLQILLPSLELHNFTPKHLKMSPRMLLKALAFIYFESSPSLWWSEKSLTDLGIMCI